MRVTRREHLAGPRIQHEIRARGDRGGFSESGWNEHQRRDRDDEQAPHGCAGYRGTVPEPRETASADGRRERYFTRMRWPITSEFVLASGFNSWIRSTVVSNLSATVPNVSPDSIT